ncbi:hypothetical protein BH24ACI4_BH24ACI4_33710 [soil metagenome]
MEDGRTAEVGTTGSEGALGLSAWMGLPLSPTTVIGQIPGSARAVRSMCSNARPRRCRTSGD